jgi:hypothetical protein
MAGIKYNLKVSSLKKFSNTHHNYHNSIKNNLKHIHPKNSGLILSMLLSNLKIIILLIQIHLLIICYNYLIHSLLN